MAKKDSPAAGTSGGQGAGNPAAASLAPENIGESALGLAATSNQTLATGSTIEGASLTGPVSDGASQGAGNSSADSVAPENIGESTLGPAATSNQKWATGGIIDGEWLGGPFFDGANRGMGALLASMTRERVPAISVTAHRDGYRRAGRAWSKKEAVVPIGDFNEEQIHQLRLDLNLTVHGVYIDGEADGDQQ